MAYILHSHLQNLLHWQAGIHERCCFAVLEEVIPNPKPRSERWVSGAFLPDSEDPDAGMCSAGYQVCLPISCWILLGSGESNEG